MRYMESFLIKLSGCLRQIFDLHLQRAKAAVAMFVASILKSFKLVHKLTVEIQVN